MKTTWFAWASSQDPRRSGRPQNPPCARWCTQRLNWLLDRGRGPLLRTQHMPRTRRPSHVNRRLRRPQPTQKTRLTRPLSLRIADPLLLRSQMPWPQPLPHHLNLDDQESLTSTASVHQTMSNPSARFSPHHVCLTDLLHPGILDHLTHHHRTGSTTLGILEQSLRSRPRLEPTHAISGPTFGIRARTSALTHESTPVQTITSILVSIHVLILEAILATFGTSLLRIPATCVATLGTLVVLPLLPRATTTRLVAGGVPPEPSLPLQFLTTSALTVVDSPHHHHLLLPAPALALVVTLLRHLCPLPVAHPPATHTFGETIGTGRHLPATTTRATDMGTHLPTKVACTRKARVRPQRMPRRAVHRSSGTSNLASSAKSCSSLTTTI